MAATTPAPETQLPGRSAWPTAWARVAEMFPGTIGLTFVVVVIGVLTGTVLRSQHPWMLAHLGTDLDAITDGRWYTIAVSTLIEANAGLKWHQPLVLLLFIGFLEYQAGTARMLVTVFVSDWVSSLLTVGVLAALAALGSGTADRLMHTPDMGTSGAAFGAVAAGIVLMPRPWREISAAVLLAFFAGAFAFERLDVSIAHPLAAAAGVGLALFAWKRPVRRLPLPGLPDPQREN